MLERHRDLLKQGAILVDENDLSEEVRALVYLEHSIQDARKGTEGRRRVVSRRMQFVTIDKAGNAGNAGYAPYLDYRPLAADERSLVEPVLADLALREEIESKASSYAITNLVAQHLQEVKQRKESLIDKTLAAVQDRLTKEINYWDHRAAELRLQESAGKPNARLNSAKAQQRADDLVARLEKRRNDLNQERQLSPMPPVVSGGALIVPVGLLTRLSGKRVEPGTFARETKRVEMLAMRAVAAKEKALGYAPSDVSAQKCGYDIESELPGEGLLRFIEVKGRIQGARDVVVTRNEILTALNRPDTFILALVEVPEGEAVAPEDCRVRYVWKPFEKEPDWADEKVVKNWKMLWDVGEAV